MQWIVVFLVHKPNANLLECQSVLSLNAFSRALSKYIHTSRVKGKYWVLDKQSEMNFLNVCYIFSPHFRAQNSPEKRKFMALLQRYSAFPSNFLLLPLHLSSFQRYICVYISIKRNTFTSLPHSTHKFHWWMKEEKCWLIWVHKINRVTPFHSLRMESPPSKPRTLNTMKTPFMHCRLFPLWPFSQLCAI